MRRSVVVLTFIVLMSLTASTSRAVYSPLTVTNALWGSQQAPLPAEPGTNSNPYTVYIQNIGIQSAVNVTATLRLSYPFTASGGGYSTSNTLTILPGSANFPTTFYLNIDGHAAKGVYHVTLELSYTVVATDFDDKFTVNLPVTNAANLTVQSAAWGPPAAPMTVSPGTRNAPLILTLKNVGDATAYGAAATLHVSKPFTYDVTEANDTQTARLGTIPAGGSATAQLTLSIDPGLKTGLYPIVVTISYNGLDVNQTVYIPVTGTVTLTVQSTAWGSTAAPISVSPGTSYATLLVNVKNAGDSAATNVTVTIHFSPPFSYDAGGTKTKETAQLGIIPAGGVSTAQFTVSVSKSIPTGLYPMNIALTSNGGTEHVETVSIPVLGFPKVVVQSYVFQNGNLFPGDTYVPLSVNLINSGNATAKDVSVELTLPPPLTASYPGSTSMTVGQIQPGVPSPALRFVLDVARATPTPLDLNLLLKISNNGIDQTYKIPVTISSFADFTEDQAKGPTMAQGATDVTMSITITNTGNATAKSAQAQLLLPNELSGNTFTYLGDMTHGFSNIATFNLDASSSATPGAYHGTVRVTWLQDNAPGRQFTKDLPVSFTVTSSLTNEILSSFTPPVIAIIVVVAAALVIIRIAMVRRQR